MSGETIDDAQPATWPQAPQIYKEPIVMKIAVQMDPLENVNPEGDTTFMMMEEAQSRGATLWSYGVDDLSYDSGDITAYARPSRVFRGARRPL